MAIDKPLEHLTVLLREAVDARQVKADGVYVDCTFGRGGHSRQILRRLGSRGRLVALDRDRDALEAAQQISDARFASVHASFSGLREVLAMQGVARVDGILM